jgi:hypothetical protein
VKQLLEGYSVLAIDEHIADESKSAALKSRNASLDV